MAIRQATLDDTSAIAELFCARIPRWQRMDDHGGVEDLPYERLTIYERWLHGGAWMSIETAAIWLSHLLRGAGEPWVLEEEGAITGYVELFLDDEGEPFGAHLQIGELVAQEPGHELRADELMRFVIERASRLRRITTNCSPYDTARAEFFRRYGFIVLERLQQITLSAQTGQGFYKAIPQPHADAAQIKGWGMPIGRQTSARQQWEMLWPSHWDAVPQIMARRMDRHHFTASGQEALLALQQHLFDPRSAEVFCWTPKALSAQVLVAIRDWAHRQGYRSLTLTVNENTARTLAPEAESVPIQQDVLLRKT